MVQDEIQNVVEQAGLDLANPNQPDNTQLSQAIPVLSRWNLPVRAIVNYGNTSPQGDHDASPDRGRIIPCDASLGNLRILLPAAASAGNGFALAVVKTDDSANKVSITPDGSDHVQGENSAFVLVSQNQSVLLASDGVSSWRVIANTQQNIDLSNLRTDIDLNASRIAVLHADKNDPESLSALDLRDGAAFTLDSMDDAVTGSQNVRIKSGKVSNAEFALYSFRGAEETYIVPQNVSSLKVKMWGAGGGGGSGKYNLNSGQIVDVGKGGAGGFVSGEISVTPGEILTLSIGGGGKSSRYLGAGGGGYTALYRGAKSPDNVLIVAGGGGGGANGAGGAGGGLQGQTANSIGGAGGGRGGTQVSGGAGGAGSRMSGSSGGAFLGGIIPHSPRPASAGGYNGGGTIPENHFSSGAGGAGYYGGGSGGANGAANDEAGGGGGSSYTDATVSNAINISGIGSQPAENTDPDWPAGVGLGGNGDGDGGNGAILLAAQSSSLNLDWITPAETTDSAVKKHRVQFLISADNLDLNTNLTVSASSNNGGSWHQLTAKQTNILDDGRKIIVAEGIDLTGGTEVQARIQTNSGIKVEISDFIHRWEN